MSGSSWWTLRSASTPSRAVPTTRNSPAASPTDVAQQPPQAARCRRPPARSGARSEAICIACATERTLDPAVRDVEPHAAPAVAAHRLADDRDRRVAAAPARAATMLRSPICIVPGVIELRRTCWRRRRAWRRARPRSAPAAPCRVDEERDRGLRELRRIACVARQAAATAAACAPARPRRARGVVQHDGDAASRARCVTSTPSPRPTAQSATLDDDLGRVGHAGRRKMRSRGVDQVQPLARRAQAASRPCRARRQPARAPARRRTSGTAAPAWRGRSRSRRCGRGSGR